MASLEIAGIKSSGGIPRNARVRVVALPKKSLVFDKKVKGPFNLQVDVGKYFIKIVHFPKGRPDLNRIYGYEQLAGLTEGQFKRLKFVMPKNAKGIMTTDGFKFICQFPGCNPDDRESDNNISAVIHESMEHMGVDPLSETQMDDIAQKYTDPKEVEAELARTEREGKVTVERDELKAQLEQALALNEKLAGLMQKRADEADKEKAGKAAIVAEAEKMPAPAAKAAPKPPPLSPMKAKIQAAAQAAAKKEGEKEAKPNAHVEKMPIGDFAPERGPKPSLRDRVRPKE